MVRLRHAGGYQSYYLHLSAFASGIRAGARVSQGQTIGFVGATGLATGPHLHYGLKRNDQWVDPVREHRNMPPGEPIPASAMTVFAAERDKALAAARCEAVRAPGPRMQGCPRRIRLGVLKRPSSLRLQPETEALSPEPSP